MLVVSDYSNIAFFDIEVGTSNKKIEWLGLVMGDIACKTSSLTKIINVFNEKKPDFICGHNFIDFDSGHLNKTLLNQFVSNIPIIDTMYLSMLLFPNKKTHKLNKPYKDNELNVDDELNVGNDPKIDAIQTQALFKFLAVEFDQLNNNLKNIYQQLLKNNSHFQGFFKYKNLTYQPINIYSFIQDKIIVDQTTFENIQAIYPFEIAIIIAFLNQPRKSAISAVITRKYPEIVGLLISLTFDEKQIDVNKFSKDEFNITAFRSFAKAKVDLLTFNKEISQEEIIQATLNQKTSVLAVLKTGGGKSLTFQIPALIKAQAYKGLTVVISPLQALMKDQISGFAKKNNNFKVVAISSYLSPIERANTIQEVESGIVDMLYLTPESLRSNTIFRLLQQRIIERFVIDEAHCLSSWGHDFRHDYYFIAQTIKELQAEQFQPNIPVSCFTATAKPEVIKEIKTYFLDQLNIDLKEYICATLRDDLDYEVYKTRNKEDKYIKLVDILCQRKKNPTIIYIPQNARLCRELSEQLNQDVLLSELDLVIEPFYAKLDDDIKEGKRAQEARNKDDILHGFIDNKIDVIIATTAFGMGIDKEDVTTVIHYQQSNSLEAYLQESGRGARKDGLRAKCIILYSYEDFDGIFSGLNRTKVEPKEIQRIVSELKKYKRDDLYISPKDIAKKMGIDTNDSNISYEEMIKTALLELEKHEIIKRNRDQYKIYATSVSDNIDNMEDVHRVISKQDALYKEMILVMQNIIQRSKTDAIEVDELADFANIDKREIANVLYELQAKKLIAFENDISIAIKNSIKRDFENHFGVENNILRDIKNCSDYKKTIDLRALNEGKKNNELILFKQVIQSWSHLSRLTQKNIFNAQFKQDFCSFKLENEEDLKELVENRKNICKFILTAIMDVFDKGGDKTQEVNLSSNKIYFDYNQQKQHTVAEFHHAFVYLHDVLKNFELRKGRLIYRQSFAIQKQGPIKEQTPYRVREHYNPSLKQYYLHKIEAVHIQIKFIEILFKTGIKNARVFITDYFASGYQDFLKKYHFDSTHQQAITKQRREKIIKDLNDEQMCIFNDNKNHAIMVLAGPGSGKTKVLVHKIASLITLECNKPEYFLMLAHSRVAVSEFRERLKNLIGNQVYELRIFTFHAFALSLLGKNVSSEESLKKIIPQATKGLNDGNLTLPYVSMLVLDEYQDVGVHTYNFISAIYKKMANDKKIIAVGDDDQCINNFGENKADIKYIKQFEQDFKPQNEPDDVDFKRYELLKNYRSDINIVNFANVFSDEIGHRLKHNNLKPHSKKNGSIYLTKYPNGHYFYGVLDQIKRSQSSNIAVLAKSNEEVLTLYSMLIDAGIKVNYITGSNEFSLGKLVELQDFFTSWQQGGNLSLARKDSDKKYQKSSNNALKNQVIDKFEKNYEQEIKQNYGLRLFEQYLAEIESDEFSRNESKVMVSTMHKAKGKEWDEVHICLKNNFISKRSDSMIYDKRLAYVSITRARKHLHIHTQCSLFDRLRPYCGAFGSYLKIDKPINTVVLMMGLSDIGLSNSYSQTGINNTHPIAGDTLEIKLNSPYIYLYKQSQQVVVLSQKMKNKITKQKDKGYALDKAIVEYVVKWQDQEKQNYLQVLCKVYLTRIIT